MDKYAIEAGKLLKAIDIAIETNIKYPSGKYTQHIIDTLTEWKQRAINPEKRYRKLASLKYLHHDIFNHYNTASGDKVDYFWKRIKEEGLDYHPVDILDKVLKKKRITNRIEYDYIGDNIVIFMQTGRTTEAQSILLQKWLMNYEKLGYDS
jgi:hypothetical protein